MQHRPEIAGIPESPLITIGALAESTPGAIKLCYGESNETTPDFISRAVYAAARAGHTFYTHTAGAPELREAIAAKIFALHHATYRPTEVMATVGATMALYITIRTLVGSGDNAVIVSPAYGSFVNAVRMSGAEARQVPLAPSGNRFALALDRVSGAIDLHTRLLIINSPSNPTGWMASESERTSLYELAERHDIVLLADEVYERLAFTEAIAPSFARITGGPTDHLVIVNSFSKTFNMTGWRLGWVQANERLIERMASAAEFITSNPTSAVQQAGIVALRDGDDYVAGLRESYRARRELALRGLRTLPGWTVAEPDGAFFAFARVDGVANSAAYAVELLQRTGVALAPGSAFGEGGEGYLRLCFASSTDVLEEAMRRLRRELL